MAKRLLKTCCLLLLVLLPTVDALAATKKPAPKVQIKSLLKTLSVDQTFSVRSRACPIKIRQKPAPSAKLIVLVCSKKRVTTQGQVVVKKKNVINMGNKTTLKLQSNRCELLVTEASNARVDIVCQAPGISPSATPSPNATVNSLTPTATPTLSASPTVTPNAQVLSFNSSITSLNTLDVTQLATVALSGIADGEKLVAITRRPRNNMLYGLGYNPTTGSIQLYIVSPRTGKLQSVSGSPKRFEDSSGIEVPVGVNADSTFSMDVNPNTDRIRIVIDNGENFRMNPSTGALIDGDFGGTSPVTGINVDGTINGLTSSVQAIAHTNTSVITGSSTLYTIDDVNDQLYIQNPQNEGDQTAAIVLTPIIDSVFGFDIPSGVNAPGSNTPVPSGKGVIGLFNGGKAKFGTLNLVTGTISTDNLPSSVNTPISLAVNQNKVGTYPIMLLTGGGTTLTRMSSAAIGTTSTSAISGVNASETLVGIDFRPANGKLVGFAINDGANNGTLYNIDPQSGAATAIGALGQVAFVSGGSPIDFSAADKWAIDINPKTDRVRVVNSLGLNFRIVPSTGAPVDGDAPTPGTNPDTALNGAAASSHGVAFTNNVFGTTVTTQYNLDLATKGLLIQDSPESGLLVFAIPVLAPDSAPLAFTQVLGFDISNDVFVESSNQSAGSGKAIAVLTVGGTTSIYELDLVTGHADSLGVLGVSGLVDIAVGYREVY